jgi:hypothetical protein
MSASEKALSKKMYQTPHFVKYGTLTEMTRASTMAGNKDGGPNNTRTG